MMNFCEPRQPDRTLEIRRRFSAEEHLLYLTIPFEVPEGVERMTISYAYASHSGETLDMESGQFTSRRRLNTIDLGLLGPGNRSARAVRTKTRYLSRRPSDAWLSGGGAYAGHLADYRWGLPRGSGRGGGELPCAV